ncbi:MAG: HAMP domain-containing histidine kinase [Crocinitomicaceae bacterium]|nr:HAMP domain-containing histidine kinase [Crocinitomicaceae bacterium]MBK8927394.1 HAMP domain-containing histidine kinase [Crocinitomicaceae bacterium]
MKLLTKNTFVSLVVSVIVFAVGGFVFYIQLTNIIDEESNEELLEKKNEVLQFVAKNNRLPNELTGEEFMVFLPSTENTLDSFSDTLIYSEMQSENLPYRILNFSLQLNGQNYQARICDAVLEQDELIETIFASFALIISAFIILLLTVNYFFSKLIWRSFFNTIEEIGIFQPSQNNLIVTKKSTILEFQQLNDAIQSMSVKISNEFKNLKTFTENASHELQTPLAIIQSKTENLLQSVGLEQAQMSELIEINRAIARLRRINQSLILLTKIENNQFTITNQIDLSEVIKDKIELYDDLIKMKKIRLSTSLISVKIPFHPDLADILVSNLLTNAIKYCPEEGEINIVSNENSLVFSNSGEKLISNGEQLFKRFYKDNIDSESTGLGLAIVESICKMHNCKVSYNFISNLHQFKIEF